MNCELWLACQEDRPEWVYSLLQLGAAVNGYSSRDGVGYEVPLHSAARTGNRELVRLLLSWGAHPGRPVRVLVPDPQDEQARQKYQVWLPLSGCRARHLAARAGFVELAEELGEAEWLLSRPGHSSRN